MRKNEEKTMTNFKEMEHEAERLQKLKDAELKKREAEEELKKLGGA